MKVEITKCVHVKEEIEIELPYYYIKDFSDDNRSILYYGKIDKNMRIVIREERPYGDWEDIQFNIKKEVYTTLTEYTLGSCLDDTYRSTKEEFEDAKNGVLELMKSI